MATPVPNALVFECPFTDEQIAKLKVAWERFQVGYRQNEQMIVVHTIPIDDEEEEPTP